MSNDDRKIVALPSRFSDHKSETELFREFRGRMSAEAQGAVPSGTVVSQGKFHFFPDEAESSPWAGYVIQFDEDGQISDLSILWDKHHIKMVLLALDKGQISLSGLAEVDVWEIPNYILEAARGS